MIKLELTSYQAIQLDALLNSLNLLSSSVGHLVAPGFSNNSELKDIAEKLRSELNSLVQPDDDWNKPEDLKPLNIQSPPDWNDYNEYLLEGGKLEYSEWRLQRLAALTQIPGNILNKTHENSDEILRRNCLDLLVPSELAVWQAKQAVEESGCHPLLTEAVILLAQAQNKVSDYVDAEKLSQSKTMKPEDESPIDKAAARYWKGQLQ